MTSKTILHIIDSLETGGAEVLLAGTVPALTSFNHVIVTLKRGHDFEKALETIPQYCLNYRSKLDLLRSVKRLREIIKKHNVDLIHSHLLTSTFIARLAKPKQLPLAFSVHNLLSESAFKISRLSKWLEKLTYKKTNHIIFVSNNAKRDYDQQIGIQGSFDILPNFVEDIFFEKYQTKHYTKHTPFRLVSVGTLKEQKNFSYLIKSLARIKDCTLDIIGDGPLKSKLNLEIKSHGVEDRVNLLGKQKDLASILPNYDLFVMASHYEGFGISAIEAMALGLPTLLSDIEVFREVAGNAATFFKPNNIEDFISKMNELKSSNKKLALLSKMGNEQAQKVSGKKEYLNKLSEIYYTLCH